MNFIHQDPEFPQLVQIVARSTGIAAALVEKDYWVTHTLWAIHRTGLDIWFKGGTSLSKGFGLIQRFSEDLDLMVERGTVDALPDITNWTSTNKGPVDKRRAFYDALAATLVVPDVKVERDTTRIDRQARSADYLARYPGALLAELSQTMSPFVRLEVGHARVVPCVRRPLDSFVHAQLVQLNLLDEYEDNRPLDVRCVHPMVTLFEKLDAMARRYSRDDMEPDTFVRHYEDAAQIIRAEDSLPDMGMTTMALVLDMLNRKDIAEFPRQDEPALVLTDSDKATAIARAYARIAPMFWGPRIPLGEACDTIRTWLGKLNPNHQ
ncbi:MAG TPA: nucleotidyl transferase AbiEii/AbiGii toxin family protein [Myxococcota bacterium]|nr:nucleotidyl transferase AbiEii/AbiGii toxin family protein [Myxococcota bacterium]HOD00576.1 nucleotidyl transferase AbiEii/AbiGii toxin family protein [Myxococcota bacterium]HOH76571.1 nucleotidyl transferase AbiEii/AbiGii toxin family protein [Myxococcota bacterium]HPV04975.1 nucleotidyl transferase AbiEii/AbiGii toxin family protein [Myxococcota bacterium]